MRIFVGVTDNRWVEFLAARRPDEVNFWRPRSKHGFKAISAGEPFLFKLHAPHDYIVGGGFLVRHTLLPVSLAWKAFEEKNGVPDPAALLRRVAELGRRQELDPLIGCTILAEPFFFERDGWVPVRSEWKKNIVVGKTYDSGQGEGAALWAEVVQRLGEPEAGADLDRRVAESPRYGQEYLTRARLGQGTFRVLVTDAYMRRCAITGERTLALRTAQALHHRAKDWVGTLILWDPNVVVGRIGG